MLQIRGALPNDPLFDLLSRPARLRQRKRLNSAHLLVRIVIVSSPVGKSGIREMHPIETEAASANMIADDNTAPPQHHPPKSRGSKLGYYRTSIACGMPTQQPVESRTSRRRTDGTASQLPQAEIPLSPLREAARGALSELPAAE